MKKTWLFSIMLLLVNIQSWAVERFPPPDFSPAYKMPGMTTPGPRAEWFTYIDIGALFVALCLASYFALIRRSRKGIVALSICSLLYFGFYRHGCICPIGAIQNTSLALFGSGYVLPVVVGVFFLLPLIFALFAGRVFCSSVCPLGAVQELILIKPLKVPDWLSHTLGGIPWIYLCFAVLLAAGGSGFIVCKYDVFVPFFRFSGNAFILSLGAAMLIVSLFIGRPYCRFICPYGALLRLISPLSRWKASVTPDKCIKCRLCENACPYGEIKYPTHDNSKLGTQEGRSRLKLLLIAAVILVITGYIAGKYAAPTLALTNPDVRLSHDLWNEQHDSGVKPSELSYSAKTQNRPLADIYKSASNAERTYKTGTPIAGAILGSILGLRLISFNVRRHREDYEADTSGCVACGRCYSSCPVEQARHGDPEAIRMLEEYS